MGKRYLARLREGAAAYQSHVRYGMVRTTKRTLRYKRIASVYFARHRMYFGGFQSLAQSEGRQYRRQSFGHHRFSRTGSTYHYYIVSSRSSYLQSTFDALLSFDVGKVHIETVYIGEKQATRIYFCFG